ncbi:hypothetical protein AYI68_g5037 [Smittium mucronatum]|uniref:Uncharacterized protein n=1 Tax=Smittium mucronatum TaxID=133383 RepID=A0A1R0GVF1_9FUNG|nr:hypothetical protein AYI68_g5037 [Smittium mucronatum]
MMNLLQNKVEFSVRIRLVHNPQSKRTSNLKTKSFYKTTPLFKKEKVPGEDEDRLGNTSEPSIDGIASSGIGTHVLDHENGKRSSNTTCNQGHPDKQQQLDLTRKPRPAVLEPIIVINRTQINRVHTNPTTTRMQKARDPILKPETDCGIGGMLGVHEPIDEQPPANTELIRQWNNNAFH